jgi:hypothetical protein
MVAVAVMVVVALGVPEGDAVGVAGLPVGVAVTVPVAVGTRPALVVLLVLSPQAVMKNVRNAPASGGMTSRGKMPFMMYLQEASPLMM